ncbi:Bcr/CflA family efflux MFS transporter [Psittacicella gerlachiana]|uniref:Bcr/CflA family efflux transporter n=1 Tax=Psittacicella gerlachiana TaxID=2028574 RepID=A0A3A1YBT0_9GAMM|nr:Bcr/CflA family efflux MFS transporter [Psittacicella gerlachiana]RIY35021.1 hypothetical protein CKF59_04255 [Psittacicella gerlachiana]
MISENNYKEDFLDSHEIKAKMVEILAQADVEQINQRRRQLMEAKLQELKDDLAKLTAANPSVSPFKEVDPELEQVSHVLSPKNNLEELDHKHKRYLQGLLPAQWVVIIIFALTSMLLPFCIDMYLSAFPAMAREYQVDVSRIEFSLSIYFVGIALGQLLWGPLADSIGRKGITSIAFIFLFISSIVIAHLDNLTMLYTLRFIQGFFCAAILVSSTSILRDIYETVDFVRINGIVTLIFFAAPFLAPLIGAYIAVASSWHYIFYSIGIMSLICFALFVKFIPETLNPAFKRKVNFKQTFKIFGQVLGDGRSFWLIMLMSCSSCVIFAYVSMASGVFQNFYGISEQVFPYIFVLSVITQVLFNIFNTKMVKYMSPAKLLLVGMVWQLLSGVFCLGASLLDTGFYGILIGVILAMSASPLIFLNSIALYLEIHYRQSGTASSLVNISRWILPGVVTAVAQHIDPYRGYTMLMTMGIFSILIFVCFLSYNFCNKRFETKEAQVA